MDNQVCGQMSFLDALDGHDGWLLSGHPDGTRNENGVIVKGVLEFMEGSLTRDNVRIELCKSGNFILFEFGYFTGTYGVGHPLVEPCPRCHRNNSPVFLSDAIYDTFMHSYISQDRNIDAKARKTLTALCRKACDRIAKEVR